MRNSVLSVILVAGALAYCAGCTPREPVASTASPPGTVRIAVADDPLSALILIADEEGLFTAEGLDVELVPAPGASTALAVLFEGDADLATSTDTPLVVASLEGRDFRIIATVGEGDADTRILARRSAGISTVADLAGKRVGTVRNGSAHFFLHILLENANLTTDDVEVRFPDPTELVTTLIEGETDAVAIRELYMQEAAARLGDDAIILEGPGLYTKPLDLVATPDFASEHKDDVARILSALIDAERLAAADPSRAVEAVTRRFAIDPESAEDQLSSANLRVTLSQSRLPALEDQTRWVLGSPKFPDIPRGAAIPNFLRKMDQMPLETVAPERVTLIR